MNIQNLIKKAIEAKEYAYAPYSDFRVGAALLAANGKVYTGCNIENVSFGATNCAERTAVFKAVSEGVREFEAIAITGDNGDYLPPCGICRQVLTEFGDDSMKVILANTVEDYRITTLGEMLPGAFCSKNLNFEIT